MYIESEELNQRIRQLTDQISELTHQEVVFEEFIAIPFYGGNIILRFTLKKEVYTLDDLDRYEKLMYEVVRDEFLIDFMGSVYRQAGVDYSELENKLLSFKDQYQDVAIPDSVQKEKILEDTRYLLEKCELPLDSKVWEIQVEDPMPLILLGNTNQLVKRVGNIEVMETKQDACLGLMRATMYAKAHHISLGRMISEG